MGETYRVRIDIGRIQSNLFHYEGGRLTVPEIRGWLKSVGFVPDDDGFCWLADRECLSRLLRTEIIEATPLALSA